MIIKKIFLSLFILLTMSAQVYAYNIYNHTKESVTVRDLGPRGMVATIKPNSYASCNPKAKGCYGDMEFKVFSDHREVLCKWTGKLSKGPGHYFVIYPNQKIKYPAYGSCYLNYYHD